MGLKIEYLEGDGGDYPLIRIFGRDAEAVSRLMTAIGALTVGGPAAALHRISGVEAVNCSLSATMSDRDREGLRPSGKDGAFRWVMSQRRREAVLGLLEPFQSLSQHDTFQWLNGPGARGDSGGGIGLVITTSDLGRW